jgi:trk system potassium uptake protein TrkA
MKVLIVGAGEVGFHIAGHLAREKKDVVVIDEDPDALRRVGDHIDALVVEGSGSNPTVLKEAGLKEAEIVMAVTNSDEINLVACLMADLISPGTKKMARLRDAGYDGYHDQLRDQPPHIDVVINPEIEVVKTIQHMMRIPGAAEIGEFANGRVSFIGVGLEENAAVCGHRLSDLSTRSGQTVPLVAAIVRRDELIIPRGSDQLLAGDRLYFISEEKLLAEALAAFGKQTRPLKRALIVGGGAIGLRLAASLERDDISTKIIEKDPLRCQFLAQQLNKTLVLQGDGSDQNLLNEENIKDMDAVITLTGNEETNILSSLLARRLGARKTITKINKFSYFPIMSAIGIEQVVSPRLSAINSILQHIRRGKVLSAISVHGEQAEVIEAVALETSDIVGKPLKDVAFPKGSLVIGIIRNDKVIIPSGASVVAPDDHIIIFATRDAIAKIEKILAVKLEYF